MIYTVKIVFLSVFLAACSGAIPALVSNLTETPSKKKHIELVEQLIKDKRISSQDYKILKDSEKAFAKDIEIHTERKIETDFIINPIIVFIFSAIWFNIGKLARKKTYENIYIFFAIPLIIFILGYKYQPYIHSSFFVLGWYIHYRANKRKN